jgi:two-component system LytT family sensor kinase
VPRRLSPIVLVAFVSTAVGVYFASQIRYASAFSSDVSWGQALSVNLTYYWVWGALVPVVVALARRFPLDGGRRMTGFLTHLLLGALVTAVGILASAFILKALAMNPQYQYEGFLKRAFVANFHSSYPTYWVILLAYLSFDYYARYEDHALRVAKLEARLFEAQLTALRMQLNPHFLFNTLNSISALMYTDVAAADAMMTRLSELLRLTLDGEGKPEVSLRREIDVLRKYVAIEQVRFEERLSVRIDIADDVLDARVPAFVLQPLVENAIRYAVAPRPLGGKLDLTARRCAATLEITLTDDGPGLDPSGSREGVGLRNTRERLTQLYGASHSFELGNRAEGGLRVSLTIPFRAAS